ncbi:hypothetical protein SLA2020_344640 [Shorea laevis]
MTSLFLYASLNPKLPRAKTIPARDTVIDFGKHRGKMLGSLPSNYLKWVSTNLRASHYLHWANLAQEVLQDPVYRDRIEWEFAQNVLQGNNNTSFPRNQNAVSLLSEINERFSWDMEDKVGWSKVDFELLGTSKGGRIPRTGNNTGGRRGKAELRRERDGGESGEKASGGSGERRRERRERGRLKRQDKVSKIDPVAEAEQNRGDGDGGQSQDVYNPFPGREALLNKVLNRKRLL